MQKSVKRGIRRENVEKHFKKRYKIYDAFMQYEKAQKEGIKVNFYSLKTTGRPCSCWLCKRKRYKRSTEKREEQEELLRD